MTAFDDHRRRGVYLLQTARRELTARQRRRVAKKAAAAKLRAEKASTS